MNDDKETALALNRLAREQAKYRLLLDIQVDMAVCEIEGWDKTEYIRELQEVLNGFKTGNHQADA